jgi:hypothetical protein
MKKPIVSSQVIYLNDVELKVYYTWYPPHKGARDSFMGRSNVGPQLEPDEPAFIEIEKVCAPMSNTIEPEITSLLIDWIDKIEQLVEKEISNEEDY